MTPRLFAIDGNWIIHRIFHTTTYETSDKGRAIAYNFLSRVCQDAIAVRATHVMVAFDGSSVFRYGIYPEYKGGRADNSEIYQYLPAVKGLLRTAGIPVAHRKRYEADDVLCCAATRFSGDFDVVIGTRDKDAYQYLKKGVRLYDSSFRVHGELRPRFVRVEDVEALFGVPASLARSYQTLVGDKGDGVPQLITPAKARNGLLKWGSVKNWCAHDKEMRAFVRANQEALKLNQKLVTLIEDALPEDFDPSFTKSPEHHLPKVYYAFADMLAPRSRGLF